jgi:hypothetical protein
MVVTIGEFFTWARCYSCYIAGYSQCIEAASCIAYAFLRIFILFL